MSTSLTSIDKLEALAKSYADARAVLAERFDSADEEMRAIYRRKMPGIKLALAAATDAQAALAAAVQGQPELFLKPRTMTLHGIKFGFQKGKGGVDWDDADHVVERIEKHFKADAPLYLIITKKPGKDRLIELDAGTLKKLGCTVTDTGDFVTIKAADTQLDKLVAKLLEEGARVGEEDPS